MRQAENRVKIEGYLSQTDLKYGSFMRNGREIESIGGSIKILVTQPINGVDKELEIPVYMFSTKYTKQGKVNPAYESIERVMKDFVSISAAGGKDGADKVRITNGQIKMNEFYGQNGQLVSMPRIQASFVTKVTGECKPEATFNVEFVVSGVNRMTDSDGVELDPPKVAITTIVPQYTAPDADVPNVDVVTFYASNPMVVDAVESYWEEGNTYHANGRLNFSSTTEEIKENVGFGEATTKTRTISVSELLVTGGDQDPADEDFAFNLDEIRAGMAARKTRLEALKQSKALPKKTPGATTAKGKLDLGF